MHIARSIDALTTLQSRNDNPDKITKSKSPKTTIINSQTSKTPQRTIVTKNIVQDD